MTIQERTKDRAIGVNAGNGGWRPGFVVKRIVSFVRVRTEGGGRTRRLRQPGQLRPRDPALGGADRPAAEEG